MMFGLQKHLYDAMPPQIFKKCPHDLRANTPPSLTQIDLIDQRLSSTGLEAVSLDDHNIALIIVHQIHRTKFIVLKQRR